MKLDSHTKICWYRIKQQFLFLIYFIYSQIFLTENKNFYLLTSCPVMSTECILVNDILLITQHPQHPVSFQ